MRIVPRIVLSLFAVTLLIPGWASAQETDPEITLVEAILGSSLPNELKKFTHLSNGYRCNPWRFLRSPRQVMEEHQAAKLAGDINKAMCDYAPYARVLTADGVDVGRDEIEQSYLNLVQLFGGALPSVTGMHSTGEVVMVNWELDTPFASIPDGVDTFVVRFGQIWYQTVHARVEFKQ